MNKTTDDSDPDRKTADAETIVAGLKSRRDELQRLYKKVSFRWWILVISLVIGVLFGWMSITNPETSVTDWSQWKKLIGGSVIAGLIYIFFVWMLRKGYRESIAREDQILQWRTNHKSSRIFRKRISLQNLLKSTLNILTSIICRPNLKLIKASHCALLFLLFHF